jgi:hypothetical protein
MVSSGTVIKCSVFYVEHASMACWDNVIAWNVISLLLPSNLDCNLSLAIAPALTNG